LDPGPGPFAVNFDANGGFPEPEPRTVAKGGTVPQPRNVSLKRHTLEGWYTDYGTFADKWDFAARTVTQEIILSARWEAVPPSGGLTSIADIKAYLAGQASGATVPLVVDLDLGDMDDHNSGWWALLTAISQYNGYVELDLSVCTMGETGVGTIFNPDIYTVGTASEGKGKIVSLVLPNAAESIPNGVNNASTFRYFTRLASIKGARLISIGQYAFSGADIPYPQGVVDLPADFPALETIETYAFRASPGLVSIKLPEGLASIGVSTFQNCTDLASIIIPDSVTSIGNSAFNGCTSLVSVGLPAGLTTIGISAFQNCTSLASVTIPETVTTIAVNVFNGCSQLQTLTVRRYIAGPPVQITALNNTALTNTHVNLVIRVPAEAVDAYKAATGWSTYAGKIEAIQ